MKFRLFHAAPFRERAANAVFAMVERHLDDLREVKSLAVGGLRNLLSTAKAVGQHQRIG